MLNNFNFKLKEKCLFVLSFCGITCKKRIKCKDVENLQLENFSYSYIVNTSNNILKLKKGNKCLYFRESKKHLNKKDYFQQILYGYNKASRKGFYISYKDINLKKFYKIGNLANHNSLIWKFLHGCDDVVRKMGIKDAGCDLANLKDFMSYAWSEVFTYNLNKRVGVGNYQIYNSMRTIATYQVSKLLGLNYLIPETKYAIIDKFAFGTVMEEARGESFDSLNASSRYELITPNLQKDLLNLNFLDVICYEKDHRPDNYNVVIEEGKVISISAFDNDSPASFLPTQNISFSTYVGCSEFVGKDEMVNRPYLDKDVIEKFLNIQDSEYREILKNYLTDLQIYFLIKRVHKLKKSIVKSIKLGKLKLLSTYEWSYETINHENSGEYGLTYLKLFASNWKNQNK